MLPIFDLENLFINLRSKSVGSVTTIGLPCNNCEEQNQFEINLEDIKINTDKK